MLNNTGQIECPSCHTLNDPEERFCIECGGRLVAPNSAREPVSAAAPEAHEQERAADELAFEPLQAQEARSANEVDIPVIVSGDVSVDQAIGETKVRNVVPAVNSERFETDEELISLTEETADADVFVPIKDLADAQSLVGNMSVPEQAPALPQEAPQDTYRIFAEGLPEWTIMPPQSPIRRKR